MILQTHPHWQARFSGASYKTMRGIYSAKETEERRTRFKKMLRTSLPFRRKKPPQTQKMAA